MIEEKKLEKMREDFRQLLANRKKIAAEIPIDYVTFTRFLKRKAGIGDKNYKKCLEYLKQNRGGADL